VNVDQTNKAVCIRSILSTRLSARVLLYGMVCWNGNAKFVSRPAMGQRARNSPRIKCKLQNHVMLHVNTGGGVMRSMPHTGVLRTRNQSMVSCAESALLKQWLLKNLEQPCNAGVAA
jgi:hypothetical protein